ncbi:hypothetical protein NMY22_g3055 [Coprinellus aureogranulatus]|nr:hypothetical protein NMY22_g3055 [Coprinellus aureogranulatus]
MLSRPCILALSLLPSFAQAKVYENFAQLVLGRTSFDFIVVGSGPGGATVASRLSENPDFNVLLVEAGPDNEGGGETLRVPGFFLQMPARYTWNYTTVANPALNNRTLNYTRGYVLGGSSSINGMVYSRGSAEDYDLWVDATGDEGWSWDALAPYFAENERLVAPPGGHDVTGEYDPRFHSETGQVFVSLPSYGPTDFDQRCLNTSASQPEFPFLLDMNSGSPIGLGLKITAAWQQNTIGNGERSSAATAYLGSDVRSRPNFSILLNTYVTRVLPSSSIGGRLSIQQVEVGDKATKSVLGSLTASKEIILSAGVIGTPQILLNSGIGTAVELRALGIEPIHNLPDVGKGLSDHTSNLVAWSANTRDPIIDQERDLQEWRENRTGLLTLCTPSRLLLWSRIPESSPFWKEFADDPASGPNTPHFEAIIGILGEGFAVGNLVWYSSPSRGSVTLRSSNPFDDPVIDDANLHSPIDIAAFDEGFRIMQRFFSGAQWNSTSDPYLKTPLFPDPASQLAQWETFLRSSADTSLHGVGTAAMSRKDAREGVVDAELKVKGVEGLRVVDGSAIPRVTAGHTQVPRRTKKLLEVALATWPL